MRTFLRRPLWLLAGSRTPARLRRRGAVLVLLCVLTAVLGALAGTTRLDATGDTGTRLATLDYDAAELYQALNGANASAATGLGGDRTGSPTMLTRYDTYVTGAYLRLDHASSLLGPDEPDTASLETIAYLLPRYTAGIDAARALRTQDPALAQTQLDSATALMSSTLLPAADTVQNDRRVALAADYERAGGFPWLPVLAAAAAVLALITVSVLEARRTRRVFSAGLLVATVLMVAALGWWTWASVAAGTRQDAAAAHNAAATELGHARIVMLQARALEIDTLANGTPAATGTPGPSLDEMFIQVLGPGGTLDAAGSAAAHDPSVPAPDIEGVRDTVATWQAALRGHGVGSEESRSTFVRLTTTVTGQVHLEQGRRTAAVEATRSALLGLDAGPTALAVAAALASMIAIWLRIREYR